MNKKMLLAVMVISSSALMHGMQEEQGKEEQVSLPPKRGNSTLVRSQRIGPKTATAVTMLTPEEVQGRPASALPTNRRGSGPVASYNGDLDLQQQIREEADRRAAEKDATAQAKRTQGGTHTDE